MPLSEHEQRLLDEMERSLYQNDADFVATVGSGRGGTNYRRSCSASSLAVVGVGVLVAGVVVRQPLVGIVGFALMFAGVLLAIAPRRRTAAPDPRRSALEAASAASGRQRRLHGPPERPVGQAPGRPG